MMVTISPNHGREPGRETMTDTDLFEQARSGGSYPKVEDLEGKLVLVRPSKTEEVDGKFGKQDRVTADVTVFEDDGSAETYSDMYLSQRGMVPSLKRALNGQAKPFILGRVAMVPVKDTKGLDGKPITDTETLKTALSEWARKGGRGEKPRFAWVFGPFEEGDADKARAFLASKDPFSVG
jgi:hypothetical protein